jgi:hypothetical protein
MTPVCRAILFLIAFTAPVLPAKAVYDTPSTHYKPPHGGFPGSSETEPEVRVSELVVQHILNGQPGPHTVIRNFLDPRDRASLALVDWEAWKLELHLRKKAERKRVAAEALRLKGTPIIPVNRFEAVRLGWVSRGFAQLGAMYEFPRLAVPSEDGADGIPTLIISDAPRLPNEELIKMKQPQALAFCARLGAKLPSAQDWNAFRKALGRGTPTGFNSSLIPGLRDERFWSESAHPVFTNSFSFFRSQNGSIPDFNESHLISVRCVVPGSALLR